MLRAPPAGRCGGGGGELYHRVHHWSVFACAVGSVSVTPPPSVNTSRRNRPSFLSPSQKVADTSRRNKPSIEGISSRRQSKHLRESMGDKDKDGRQYFILITPGAESLRRIPGYKARARAERSRAACRYDILLEFTTMLTRGARSDGACHPAVFYLAHTRRLFNK